MSNKENNRNIPEEKKCQSNKNNITRSSSSEPTSQTVNFLATEDISNKLNDYIAYVKKLEIKNNKISKENQKIIEERRKEITELRRTYNDEICALRSALDNVASEKVGLGIELTRKVEDLNSLKSKYREKSESLLILQQTYNDLQDDYLENKRKLMNMKSSHHDYEDNERKVEVIKEELQNKTQLYAELENRFETLKEEVAFYKKIDASESKIDPVIEETSENHNKFDPGHIEDLKENIRFDFEERLDVINESYNARIDELTKTNENLLEKNKLLNSDLRQLKSSYENANKLLAEKEKKICELNSKVSNHTSEIAAIDNSYEIKHQSMIEEIEQLREDLNRKIVDISKYTSEKTSLENKLYMFQSVLDGEQSRCNLDSPYPRRKRKYIADSERMTMTANSTGKVRFGCDDNTDEYLILINDLHREINLNEWKLEILVSGSKEKMIYSFPPFILKAGKMLKIWNCNIQIEEDEENLLLNVELPHNVEFSCKLSDDMNQCEANFEIKKDNRNKRCKKERPGDKKDSCSMM